MSKVFDIISAFGRWDLSTNYTTMIIFFLRVTFFLEHSALTGLNLRTLFADTWTLRRIPKCGMPLHFVASIIFNIFCVFKSYFYTQYQTGLQGPLSLWKRHTSMAVCVAAVTRSWR